MRRLRRLSRGIALVLSVVFASISLAGGGSTCMASDGASMRMTMPMHGQAMSPAAASHGSAETPAPCHLPMAPNACVGMATCATVALPIVAVASTTVRAASERVIDRTVELAAGDARAPELPPPRA